MIRSDQEIAISTRESSSAPEVRITFTTTTPKIVHVASDNWNFEIASSGQVWIPRGVNIGFHAANPPCGAYIEDFWATDWPLLETDFNDAIDLGFNSLRIFLHLPAYMGSASDFNEESFLRLDQVVRMANRKGIRLILTGLMNTDRSRIPPWFSSLDDDSQTAVEARFWEHLAKRYPGQSSIYAYDVQNEPAMQATTEVVSNPLSATCPASSWVHFHGRSPQAAWDSFVTSRYGTATALGAAWSDFPRAGEAWPGPFGYGAASGDEARFRDWMEFRSREARSWVEEMTTAIRSNDPTHLVTVGRATTPFQNEASHLACRPYGSGSGFTTFATADLVDFISLHHYPARITARPGCATAPPAGASNLDVLHASQRSAGVYGKPVVLEELDPYQIGAGDPEWTIFANRTLSTVSGWFGQWDGRSRAEMIADGAVFPLGRLDATTAFFATIPNSGVTRAPAMSTVAISEVAQVRNPTQRHELMAAYVAFRDAGYLVDLELVP